MMIESKHIRNPFPGLRPFETDEYRLFFGREGQSDELLSRLQRSRFLAVVGTSGSGKSSLIRAGLMPALLGGMMEGAGAGWRVVVMRPGGDPIGNLAVELAKKDVLSDAGAGLRDDEAEALIDATLRSSSLGIVNVAYRGRLREHEKLLIVVDQFEELFRFRAAREGTSTGDEAAAFVKLLLEAAQQRELAIYVVLTMRSDFLGDCAQFQGLPEAINDGQYLIPRMTRDERRFAVTGPVGVTRGKIAEPLVNRLLNDVGDQPDQLPSLQHALMRTWEHWRTRRRNGEAIGIEHYEAIGTMSEALSRHADEAFNELPDERSRQIAEKLFKCLSERGGDNREIRRPTRLDAICEIADASMNEVIAVIDVFRASGRSFLMPPIDTALHPDTVIDISHESLIRNWQRLKQWVNEEAQSARIYRRLAETSVLHREGSEGVLQDPFLQIALDWQEQDLPAAWANRYHPDFETAITYLDESRKASEARTAAEEKRRNEEIERDRRELEQTKAFVAQQARSARRMRWLIAALCLILLMAIGTAAYAFNLRADALESRRAALLDKEGAERSAAIASAATQLAEERTTAARKSEYDALEAQRQMRIEQQNAEQSAREAKQQAAIALTNLHAAQIATAEANEAKKDALDKAQQVTAALERGELVRVGLESSRREDFDKAEEAFKNLQEKLKPLQNQFAYDYGWTLSRLADTHHKQKDFEDAIEAYESGRIILEETSRDQPHAILFENYQGLAQAYHDNVRYGTPVYAAPLRITLTRDQQLEKAEEFFKKAAAYQQKLKSNDPLASVNTLKNLAQLYIDTRKYDLAEESLKKVVEAHKSAKSAPGQDPVSALKQLAAFYIDQGEFQKAAKTYDELIDIQENTRFDSNELALRTLSDSYSDLGQIYTSLKDEERSDNMFELADKFQAIALKIKSHGGEKESFFKESENFDEDFDVVGDIYVKLGRFVQAKEAYETALGIRSGINSEKHSPAISWLKLARLYKDHLKDNKKAEEYYKLVIDNLKTLGGRLQGPNDPLSQYVTALQDLARLYTGDLNKPAEAETLLNTALAALAPITSRLAWSAEYYTSTDLVWLYKKHRPAELHRIYTTRLELMNKRRADIVATAQRTEDYPLFMAAYIVAVGEAAASHLSQNNKEQAEATYRLAFDNPPLILDRLRYSFMVEEYASTLENYQALLRDLKKSAEAAKFDELIKQARAREKELKTRESEPRQEPETQAPPPPGAD